MREKAVRDQLYRLRVMEGGHEAGAHWVWATGGDSQTVSFAVPALYKAGRHELRIGNLSAETEVASLPASFVCGDYAEIVSPRTPGEVTRVKATVKNVGSTSGTHVVELRADGQVVVSQKVELGPGEEVAVTLEHTFTNDHPRVLSFG